MNASGFEEFCGGPFWNETLLLDNFWPEFTPCFISTVLVWIPCGYVWLLFPYFLYDVHNPLSTNNLHPKDVITTTTVKVHPHNIAQKTAYGGPATAKKAAARGDFTTVLTLKILLTLLLAVLSLIQLFFNIKDNELTVHIVAAALYLASYFLVAFQLWYERRRERKALFMSFFFYVMNIILGIIPMYTWVISEDYRRFQITFSIFVLCYIFNCSCFVLNFVPDNVTRTRKDYEEIGANPCPEVSATYPSQILFLWMLRLMLVGFRREITKDDLWDLNPRDQGRRINKLFDRYWEDELDRVDKINSLHFSDISLSTEMRGISQKGRGSSLTTENGIRKDNPVESKHHQRPVLKKTHSISAAVLYEGAHERTSLLLAEGTKISGSDVPLSDVQPKQPSLFRVLCRLLWKNTLTAFIQKLLADISLFLGPLILGVLIEKLQYPDEEKEWQVYTVALGLLVTGLVKSLLFAHSMYRSALMGIHIKTVLIAAVYKKSLTISSSAKKGSTVGEIVNLMSVDCQRLQEILTVLFFMWTTPFQIIIAVVLLYVTVGPAVLTGVALLLLLVPINTWIGSKQKLLQEAVLKIKDARIKLVNEILSGMKVLKLYAWEDEFKRKVESVRQREVNQLYKVAFLYVLSGLCWGIAPFLVGLLTFATYVLIDRNNVLDPQKAFVSLALFNILRVPLNYVSTIIIYTVQTYVSVKRVNKFLVTEDLDLTNTTWDPTAEHAICINGGTFTWDRDLKPTLKNINLTVSVGQVTAIVGPVGCGKTSLISAILGEMEKVRGYVTVKGKVAYVSQQAWIQNATVKDNILFGKKYNKHRYAQVIKACELERDLEILDAGDMTEIGEKGINLSGGQKQRINLARAVYSDSDVYLFDDPLSAVDAHVGKAIFKNVMSHKGVLANKTRVLVTHGVHWLPQVDDIVVLSGGVVSEHGPYDNLVSRNGPFAQFLQIYLLNNTNGAGQKDQADSDDDEELRAVKDQMRSAVERVTSDTGNTSADEFTYFTKMEQPKRRKRVRHYESSLSQPLLIHESLDLTMTMTSSLISIHPVGGKLILEETLESGKVKRDVFTTYARAAGIIGITTAFLSYGLNQGFMVWSSFFLTKWTEDPLLLNATTRTAPEGQKRLDYYLLVYGVFFTVTQLITFVVFNYLFWYRMVRAAERLHHLLLDRLFHAPMSFFDQTPIGRILNRFSKDVDTVDNTLPLILRDWLVTGSIILVTLIIVLIQTPVFAAVLIPLCVFFYIIQNYYVRTSRQLKRIESITRSPIYIHFSESITGAAVIRAYGVADRFIAESEDRVDKNQIYFFASQAAIRWLQLNMDILANLVVLFAAILQITGGGGGSDAGLSVSYALQISGSLTYMVRQICEFETNIVSVERMKEYSQVAQEAALINKNYRPPIAWPDDGNVKFTDYQTRYREGLDLVLKGVNCNISGGEKIGIVGRTGAGKSSLTLCLFRIIEAVSGAITIDGINIADIGLHDLRGKLTILPQDPVLFSGSLRMNIDPFEQYTDDELWKAIERSHLKDFVASQPDSLMYECGEEGSNLSIGQRQLVCLARALLRHTKILILDEATAAIDMETDALIQKTIREAFSDCTIIAIAHRLNTIMDYDRIIVMDAGVISEFDTPKNLINSKGVFYSMCKDAGLV